MSLKKKFLILIFLTLCITLSVSFFAYEKLKTDIMSITGSLFLKKQIQFNRERVLHPLMRELALAQKLAGSPVLLKWAKNEKNQECMKNGIAELESFRNFFADKSYFVAICSSRNYYFNNSSNNFAGKQLRYQLDSKEPENRWFFATLESKDDYRLNVDHDEKLGETKVWINVVFKDGDRPLGIVGTGIDLSEFINKVIGSSQLGISNILIEEDGAIQAHTKVEQIDYRTISKSFAERKTFFSMLTGAKDQEKFSAAMKETKNNDQAIPVFFAEINGRCHLLGLTYIKGIDWYNVSILDVEKVIGKNKFLPFAGLLLFATMIFSIVIYILLNKFIFSRILRLDKSVRGFARGIIPDYPENPIADEVGNLEEGFGQMVKVVKANADELELRVIKRTDELELKNNDLEKAIEEIKVLSGLLPICSHCKDIRDDKGYWHNVETYVGKRTNAKFSHGICPDCIEKHYPQYSDKIKK
jgi:HAMP domain-containing protein